MRRAPLFVAAAVGTLLVALAPVPVAAATRTSFQPQITHGADAAPARWPFMVALVVADKPSNGSAQFCGGSLIDPSWVLTAAHCVVTENGTVAASRIDVLVGTTDLASGGTRVRAAEIKVHPGYTAQGAQNDAALIHLTTPQSAATISYAGAGDAALEAPGSTMTLLGWGGTSADQQNQTYPSLLQQATMPILGNDSCAGHPGFESFDAVDMLCAGAPAQDADGGIDACQGDSGGPLFATRGDGTNVELGIVSFGPTCGYTPTAYTRVSTYSQWIGDSIGAKTAPRSPLPPGVSRLSGPNRYATAAAVATGRFSSPLPIAYIVTGTSFPDALAVAPLASRHGGAVLLTAPDALPAETRDALAALHPSAVVIAGGEGAVSAGVADALRAVTGVEPTRIAGADRYETAARISADGASTSPPQAQTVLVASGASYADALGGAAAGAASAAPLLLTDPQSLPDATATEITRLHPTDVFVLGGTGAVSDAVADAIRALGPSVTRIAGANRYETSAMIATTIFSNGASEAMLATGLDFPDGLVAGAIGHPVLLLPRADDVPAQIPDAVAALSVTVLTIMGGSAAVSDAQASAVAAARR